MAIGKKNVPFENKKIAIISEIPTPYRTPFFQMLFEKAFKNIKVFFCSLSSPNRKWKIKMDESFPYKILPGFYIKIPFVESPYFINPSILWELIRGKFDMIVVGGYNHFTTQVAIIYAWLTKTPYLFMCESHLRKHRNIVLMIIKKIFVTPIIKNMSAGLPTGTLAREYLCSYGAKAHSTFFIANTPNLNFFRKKCKEKAKNYDKIKKKFGIQGKDVILYVGRLVEQKGIKYLLNAVKMLNSDSLALLLIGDGPLRRKLESKCYIEDIKNVYFLSFKQKEQLPQFYAVADIFVLPSVREPWGVVINEAMACGLPIIATNKVGAAVDLVHEGKNGFLVPEKDSEAICDAIRKIVTNKSLRQQMGEKSCEIISNWSHEKSVENFVDAIKYTENKR